MSAPVFQSFNALTGDLAPSPVGKILDTAGEISGQAEELECLREENAQLLCRVDELDGIAGGLLEAKAALEQQLGQRRETVEFLSRSRSQAMVDADVQARKVALLTAENNDLAERLRELDECHQITLARLAAANAQLTRMQATR